MTVNKGPGSIDDKLFDFGGSLPTATQENGKYSAPPKPYENKRYDAQNKADQGYQNGTKYQSGSSGAYVTGCIGCFPFPFLPFVIPIGWLSDKYRKK